MRSTDTELATRQAPQMPIVRGCEILIRIERHSRPPDFLSRILLELSGSYFRQMLCKHIFGVQFEEAGIMLRPVQLSALQIAKVGQRPWNFHGSRAKSQVLLICLCPTAALSSSHDVYTHLPATYNPIDLRIPI